MRTVVTTNLYARIACCMKKIPLKPRLLQKLAQIKCTLRLLVSCFKCQAIFSVKQNFFIKYDRSDFIYDQKKETQLE